jgi:hypothetical protein
LHPDLQRLPRQAAVIKISEFKMKPMFNAISWDEYFIFLAISTALYYLVVYLLYFRNAGEISLQTKHRTYDGEQSSREQPPTLLDQETYAEENLQHIVYACMDELNAFFENQKSSKAVKSEVMYALYGILQKYSSLRNCDYKESITNVIALQCENICSIHLSAEELKGVWFG